MATINIVIGGHIMKISDLDNNRIVVIIKGNPEKMKGMEELAEQYYNDIYNYVTEHGYNVEFDDGKEHTCPRRDAAFWIAHSRGTDRHVCIDEEDLWKFLKFGALDGVIHPEDREWQNSLVDYHSKELPPEEHFIFTDEQKYAIDKVINNLVGK